MAERIKLVQGDNLPYIRLTLKNADGSVLAVDGATVRLYFREEGSTTTLSTLACSPVTDGADGRVQFNFPDNTLDVEPGAYEGEIEVEFPGGSKQTVYDPLKFTVRQQFA